MPDSDARSCAAPHPAGRKKSLKELGEGKRNDFLAVFTEKII